MIKSQLHWFVVLGIYLGGLHITTAQVYRVGGTVVDQASGKPLAFVNVIANNQRTGSATDIDGKFTVSSANPIDSLTFSYVGYLKKTVAVTSSNYKTVNLVKLNIELREVEVFPTTNPAHRIIKKATANKKQNNPENLPGFSYKSYNKLIYTASAEKELEEFYGTQDSSAYRMARHLEKHHLFMVESVTERKYQAPGKSKETVLGTRVSGLKKPSFSVLATDVQPFSFYEDHITLLDKAYLNPLSKGSTAKYLFILKDTAYSESDTTYIISFTQRKSKNFEALKGLLYINTNGYAIQNVIAEPYHKSLNNPRIQQKYGLVNDSTWFPAQLNFDWLMVEPGLLIQGRSYLSEVDMAPGLSRKDFTRPDVELAKIANQRTGSFWQSNRLDTLTQREIQTYTFMDSIGAEFKLDEKLTIFETLVNGKIPIGALDIPLNRIYRYNEFEKHRFGLGVETSTRLLNWFSAGGYFAYGTQDKLWKYGGRGTFYISRENAVSLEAGYDFDVEEPGQLSFLNETDLTTTSSYRRLLTSRMDRIEKYYGSLTFRALRYAKVKITGLQKHKTVLGDYRFAAIENERLSVTVDNYTLAEASVSLKYAYGERLTYQPGTNKMMSLGTDYPVLWVHATKGFDNIAGGSLEYHKITARVKESFRVKRLGKFTFQLEGGWAQGNVPATELFFGTGSYGKANYIQVDNTFQTMRLYEFLSDRFVQVFYTHNLGKLHLKTDKSKPEFLLVQNSVFGSLSAPQRHRNVAFNTLEAGYHEAGIQVRGIYRLNYLDVFYVGLGVGIYYRYGPYTLPRVIDNGAAKVVLSMSL